MSKPLVVAIMLTRDRPQMAARAVMSWLKQSYDPARRWLYILDSGTGVGAIDAMPDAPQDFNIRYHRTQHGKTIGALRNYAIGWQADILPDIFVHFDDDDISHEWRISEQVALLQASGADCCGYFEAPFWDTRPTMLPPPFDYYGEGSAWLYRDPARKHVLGASMAYWRKTWERRPFDDINHGEDTRFAGRCKTVAESAIGGTVDDGHTITVDSDPRIVCGVHGANTSGGYDFTKRQQCFTRAPQFDDYCRGAMQL